MKRYMFMIALLFGFESSGSMFGPNDIACERAERAAQARYAAAPAPAPIIYASQHPTEDSIGRADRALTTRIETFATKARVSVLLSLVSEGLWRLSDCSGEDLDRRRFDVAYKAMKALLKTTHQARSIERSHATVEPALTITGEPISLQLVRQLYALQSNEYATAYGVARDGLDLAWSRFNLAYDTHQRSLPYMRRLGNWVGSFGS